MKLIALILLSSMLAASFTCHAGTKRIKTDEKVVALTFDDGPHATNTLQILNVLAVKQVQATFFLIGEEIVKYPDIAKATLAQGHELGGGDRSATLQAVPMIIDSLRARGYEILTVGELLKK